MLAISGILALGVGLVLMFSTIPFLANQGIVADNKIAVIGQARGSLLVGVGAINLLALRCVDPRGLQAVLGGNFILQIVSSLVNVHALSAGLVNSSVWGDVGGHAILGVFFAVFFFRVNALNPA